MIKTVKYKSNTWWGFDVTQAECNCDFDNKELRTKQIFKTERERDKALNKILADSEYCVTSYSNFCTTINEKEKPHI